MNTKKKRSSRIQTDTLAGVKTRRAVLDLLKVQAMDAATMAKRLSVTAMAVRQHLYQLLEEKLVNFTEQRQAVGRPIKVWSLTPEAAKFFPDCHATLTLNILDNVRSAFGPDSVGRLLDARAKQQIEQYKERLSRATSLGDLLKGLADIRTEEGYMAEAQKEADGTYLLLEHHCPICSAATACQGFCDAELKVFSSLVEKMATVRRTSHILKGASRCAYVFTPLCE